MKIISMQRMKIIKKIEKILVLISNNAINNLQNIGLKIKPEPKKEDKSKKLKDFFKKFDQVLLNDFRKKFKNQNNEKKDNFNEESKWKLLKLANNMRNYYSHSNEYKEKNYNKIKKEWDENEKTIELIIPKIKAFEEKEKHLLFFSIFLEQYEKKLLINQIKIEKNNPIFKELNSIKNKYSINYKYKSNFVIDSKIDLIDHNIEIVNNLIYYFQKFHKKNISIESKKKIIFSTFKRLLILIYKLNKDDKHFIDKKDINQHLINRNKKIDLDLFKSSPLKNEEKNLQKEIKEIQNKIGHPPYKNKKDVKKLKILLKNKQQKLQKKLNQYFLIDNCISIKNEKNYFYNQRSFFIVSNKKNYKITFKKISKILESIDSEFNFSKLKKMIYNQKNNFQKGKEIHKSQILKSYLNNFKNPSEQQIQKFINKILSRFIFFHKSKKDNFTKEKFQSSYQELLRFIKTNKSKEYIEKLEDVFMKKRWKNLKSSKEAKITWSQSEIKLIDEILSFKNENSFKEFLSIKIREYLKNQNNNVVKLVIQKIKKRGFLLVNEESNDFEKEMELINNKRKSKYNEKLNNLFKNLFYLYKKVIKNNFNDLVFPIKDQNIDKHQKKQQNFRKIHIFKSSLFKKTKGIFWIDDSKIDDKKIIELINECIGKTIKTSSLKYIEKNYFQNANWYQSKIYKELEKVFNHEKEDEEIKIIKINKGINCYKKNVLELIDLIVKDKHFDKLKLKEKANKNFVEIYEEFKQKGKSNLFENYFENFKEFKNNNEILLALKKQIIRNAIFHESLSVLKDLKIIGKREIKFQKSLSFLRNSKILANKEIKAREFLLEKNYNSLKEFFK